MTDDKLAFLDDKEASTQPPEPMVETPAQEAQTATPEPAKPEPGATIPPGYVPLAAQLDERDKRQALQRERDELAAWKADQLAKANARPPLDPLTQPEEWAAEQRQLIANAAQDTRFEITHMVAVDKHGPEAVKAAEDWLGKEVENDPGLYQLIARQPNPYESLVQAHKRSQNLSKLGDKDPEAWAEEWAKSKGYVLQTPPVEGAEPPAAGPSRDAEGKFVAAPAIAPATPTPLPKRSLASAPAASGAAPKGPVGEGVAFNTVFKD